MLTTGDVGSLAARLSGARWHLYTLPEHLYFFSRESLRIMLERAGLKAQHMSADAAYFPLGYLAERLEKTLLQRQPPERTRGLWSVTLPVNLFDIVTVTARRPAV